MRLKGTKNDRYAGFEIFYHLVDFVHQILLRFTKFLSRWPACPHLLNAYSPPNLMQVHQFFFSWWTRCPAKKFFFETWYVLHLDCNNSHTLWPVLSFDTGTSFIVFCVVMPTWKSATVNEQLFFRFFLNQNINRIKD